MSGAGQLIASGPLILALPVAAAAGAITFISPCCLPLVPGYLSYVTGMAGEGAAVAQAPGGEPKPARGRTAAGTALFVAGFSALFASYGAAFGGLGAALLSHQKVLVQVLVGSGDHLAARPLDRRLRTAPVSLVPPGRPATVRSGRSKSHPERVVGSLCPAPGAPAPWRP